MSSPALQIPLPEKFENNQGLPDETKQEYGRILALYSSDTLDATEWHISLTIANRTGNICFPKATKTIECHKKTSERELNSMKKQNEGVLAYQESKRQNTLSKIDEAYNYLKQTHQTITKTAISMESGVSIKTICKPYIRDHLSKYPEFSHTDKGDYKSPEEMAARIEVLEDRLSKSVNRNKELLAEIQKIRAESAIKYKQLQLDYERLAGAYQKETEKKIIRL